jgi:hypothetical protein
MNTYANKGVYIEPMFVTRIEDKHGNVISRFVPRTQEAMSEETAYLMLELMKGVVESGTGIRLRFKYQLLNPIAGKTGTTQSNSDGWFMGITPDLTTGIGQVAKTAVCASAICRLGRVPTWLCRFGHCSCKKFMLIPLLIFPLKILNRRCMGSMLKPIAREFEMQQWQQQRPALYDDF